MHKSHGRAVFLDKDGTLIEDVPYNVEPALIRLRDGAAQGLPLLAEAGYELYVVTNQSGVARGLFDEAALTAVEERLRELLAEFGVELAGFLYCPHSPDGSVEAFAVDCDCRKPRPGLLQRAAGAFSLDLGASWMVGDILTDVEAGNRAGCRTVLVDDGSERDLTSVPDVCLPDFEARDLADAARLIIAAGTSHDTPRLLTGA